MPPISVVIPLYNKGPHIARTINSVLAQTVTDFEIVVVDDGSTDNGTDIVASFNDPRIRLIRQVNQGVSAARNRGISEARSDFIAFLDADDEWAPDHLETLLRLRSKFPEAGAYTTAYVRVLPGGEILSSKFKAIPPAPWEGVIPDYFKAAALGDPPVCSSAVGIPKKVFDEVGLFKVGVKMGEDLDQWLRIALAYPIVFSWSGFAWYRMDSKERVCETNESDYTLIIEKCIEAIKYGQQSHNEQGIKLFLEKFGRTHVRSLIRQHEPERARVYISRIEKVLEKKGLLLKEFAFSYLPAKLFDFLLGVKRSTRNCLFLLIILAKKFFC